MADQQERRTLKGQKVLVIAAEFLLIVTMFFVYAGGRAPAVNESHYLTRSKHFWDSTWCRGDIFLESKEAQPVFHTTFGGLSRWMSLSAYAWTGRLIGWSLLAAAWVRLNRQIIARRGWSLLTAAIALVGWEHGQMAGEWVVDSFEAKVPAYALTYLALAQIAVGQWSRAIPLLGLATAFHPLVGGWSTIAAAVAWLWSPASNGLAMEGRKVWKIDRRVWEPAGRLLSLLPWLALALVVALPGLVPALTLDAGTDAATISAARRIYVFERLDHHLLIHRFPPAHVAIHVALAGVWLALWRWSPRDEACDRLQRFVAAAVGIAVLGATVEFLTFRNVTICSSIMRYYWYRMSDSMLPAGLSLAIGNLLARSWDSRQVIARRVLIALLLILATNLSWRFATRRSDQRPAADQQGQVGGVSPSGRQREYRDWLAMCAWARRSTPPHALFLTPSHIQTFKWYAQRPEVAIWKDVPQDSQSMVAWHQRRREIDQSGLYLRGGDPSLASIGRLTRRYNVQFLVTPRRLKFPTWGLPRAYQNGSFVVYRTRNK